MATTQRIRHFPQLATGMFIWALIAGLVWFTRGLPYTEEGAPGPRFMPLVLAVSLGVLNICYWVETFYFRSGKKLVFPNASDLIRPGGFSLAGLLMLLLWERLGVVATVLVCSAFELKWVEGYSWMRALLVGVLLSVLTWTLFQWILGIPLPTGPFEFLSSF